MKTNAKSNFDTVENNTNGQRKGYFGKFGGSFVSDAVQKELDKVEAAYEEAKADENFLAELNYLRISYQGRPTPLYYCRRLTESIGGGGIYLKREDLNHTGAHKINHCIGEVLLAKRMGKTNVIAETGAGQHGLAIATACALVGLSCEIHMGEVDVAKQKSNVDKMRLLGAKIVVSQEGSKSLKEAVDSAFASYEAQLDTSIYCIGSAVGPHPFPSMVRDFQSVVGKEIKTQMLDMAQKLPDYVVACVGGGSNAIGAFYTFLNDLEVNLIGVEAFGKGIDTNQNSASITKGKQSILHGFSSLCLCDSDGKVCDAYSAASGLDYPSVGPEHAYLCERGRVRYVGIDDAEAINAFYTLSRIEGIIPALESSHALAYAMKLAKDCDKNEIIVVNLSGRGDKDVDFVINNFPCKD